MSKPKAKSPWLPGGTAPRTGEQFIGLDRGAPFGRLDKYICVAMCWDGTQFVSSFNRGLARFHPVAWMPIPPLPEGER